MPNNIEIMYIFFCIISKNGCQADLMLFLFSLYNNYKFILFTLINNNNNNKK